MTLRQILRASTARRDLSRVARSTVVAALGLAFPGLVLPACSLVAQDHGLPSDEHAVQELTPEQWSEDLRFMVARMEETHPDLYHAHSREQWESAVAEVEVRLPTLAWHEALTALRRVASLAADGHSGFRFPPSGKPGFETTYPVALRVFDDGVFVVRAPTEHRELLGSRVVTVNGLPVREAFARLRTLVSADNEMWSIRWIPMLLQAPGFVHAQGLTEQLGDPLRFELVRTDGSRLEKGVEAVAVETELEWLSADRELRQEVALPLYRRSDRNYFMERLEEDGVLYLGYRAVQNERAESLVEFADRLFDFLAANEVKKLVIDLRDNSGGNNYLNQPLLHTLIASRQINQPGRLFVLIGRATFSAAMNMAGDIETHTRALFVGEPSAAGPNHYGDAVRIELPNSGLTVFCSTLPWFSSSDPRDTRRWILPDIPAGFTFDDWISGRDPGLEAVIDFRIEDAPRTRSPRDNWRRPSQREEWPSFFGSQAQADKAEANEEGEPES